MRAREADELGKRIKELLLAGREEEAYALLAPVIGTKTPFRFLDRIGLQAGEAEAGRIFEFTDRVVESRAMGGWPFCGSALRKHLDRDPARILDLCRDYIVSGDEWYAADIMAERLPGPALVDDFDRAVRLLETWRFDSNRWVRRAVGVAVHLWAKRAKGDPEKEGAAVTLLEFMEPMFEERNADAAKGVGWGLKTMGRYYPQTTAAWLGNQLVARKRRPRAVVLRKAMTYLAPPAGKGGAKGKTP